MGDNKVNKTILVIMIVAFAVAVLFLVLYLNERSFSDFALSDSVTIDDYNQLVGDYNTLLEGSDTDIGDYNQLLSDYNKLDDDWMNTFNTLLNCYDNNLEVCNYVIPARP